MLFQMLLPVGFGCKRLVAVLTNKRILSLMLSNMDIECLFLLESLVAVLLRTLKHFGVGHLKVRVEWRENGTTC